MALPVGPGESILAERQYGQSLRSVCIANGVIRRQKGLCIGI